MGWSSYIHTDCGPKHGRAAGIRAGSGGGFVGAGTRGGAGGGAYHAATAAESNDDGAAINGSTAAYV